MQTYIYSAVAGLIGLAIGCVAVALLLRTQTKQAQTAMETARERSEAMEGNISVRSKELETESRAQGLCREIAWSRS